MQNSVSSQHLARTLQPTLVSTFLDCAPSVFSPSTIPPETELQLVLSAAEIARELYGNVNPTARVSEIHWISLSLDIHDIITSRSPMRRFMKVLMLFLAIWHRIFLLGLTGRIVLGEISRSVRGAYVAVPRLRVCRSKKPSKR